MMKKKVNEMRRISLWILRSLLLTTIILSGLEKYYSYLVQFIGIGCEANPFAGYLIGFTGMLTGHLIGFVFSVIFVYLIYKITVEFDSKIQTVIGLIALLIVISLYASVFLNNFMIWEGVQ